MKYVIIILLCAFSYPVVAAEYSVTPMLIEHTVEPRDMSEETVKITNTSGRKLRIFPTVNQITLGEGGEIKSFVPPSMSDNTTSITSWISVTRGRVEINPGETIKIPLNITVNPNAVAGEYHAQQYLRTPGGALLVLLKVLNVMKLKRLLWKVELLEWWYGYL